MVAPYLAARDHPHLPSIIIEWMRATHTRTKKLSTHRNKTTKVNLWNHLPLLLHNRARVLCVMELPFHRHIEHVGHVSFLFLLSCKVMTIIINQPTNTKHDVTTFPTQDSTQRTDEKRWLHLCKQIMIWFPLEGS